MLRDYHIIIFTLEGYRLCRIVLFVQNLFSSLNLVLPVEECTYKYEQHD